MTVDEQDHIVQLLNRLGAASPSPDKTGRALDKVRQTLAAHTSLTARRARAFKWTAAAVIAAAIVVAFFTWFLQTPNVARASFTEVLEAVEASQSVSCRMIIRASDKQPETIRFWALGNGLCRHERVDGSYTITDVKNDRSIVVDPQNREATLWQNSRPTSINPYAFIKGLPNDASARPLPGKKIGGNDVLGFAVSAFEKNVSVWVDPATRLPVAIEMGGIEHQTLIEVTLDEIEFDRDLSADLFSFEPPTGYKLEIYGVAEFPAAPAERQQRELVVTPSEGIGPVRFGMKREQVEQLLGKPDGERMAGHVVLNYGSRGVFIGIGKETGVLSISCYSQSAMALKVRDFSGQTDKGIRIGASAAEIIRAYGEPESKETKMGSTYLVYDKLQAHFTLFSDKLVGMDFYRPRGE
jgi:outer membrane lipoprotein-sorting protein